MGAPVAFGTLAGSTSGSWDSIHKEAARSDFSRFTLRSYDSHNSADRRGIGRRRATTSAGAQFDRRPSAGFGVTAPRHHVAATRGEQAPQATRQGGRRSGIAATSTTESSRPAHIVRDHPRRQTGCRALLRARHSRDLLRTRRQRVLLRFRGPRRIARQLQLPAMKGRPAAGARALIVGLARACRGGEIFMPELLLPQAGRG